MRILLDQVTYEMRNKGNIALLKAAVKRLNNLWPGASLEVITLGPILLKVYLPNCIPVPLLTVKDVRRRWQIFNSFQRLIPRSILRLLFELRDQYHNLKPNSGPNQSTQNKAGPPEYQRETVNMEWFEGVDLFVISGAQFICDSISHVALAILDRLEFAIRLGIPTVMVGQGIGPIEDPHLAARAREILPQVDYILVREKVFAPTLLHSLGVEKDRIFVTGDDAVEMAYKARSNRIGNNIGIGMRLSHYSGLQASRLDEIRNVLHEASLNYRAKFISIPISYSTYEWELDDLVNQRLSAGRNISRHGLHRYDDPLDLIKLAGKCRLVVTGAFHPAVFALAQGIPAICLSSTRSYTDSYTNKFLGLADLFGDGCEILYLDDQDIQSKLATAIDSTWNSADQLRPQLLEAARRQIEWGREGYQHIYDIVTSNNSRSSLGLRSIQI